MWLWSPEKFQTACTPNEKILFIFHPYPQLAISTKILDLCPRFLFRINYHCEHNRINPLSSLHRITEEYTRLRWGKHQNPIQLLKSKQNIDFSNICLTFLARDDLVNARTGWGAEKCKRRPQGRNGHRDRGEWGLVLTGRVMRCVPQRVKWASATQGPVTSTVPQCLTHALWTNPEKLHQDTVGVKNRMCV